MGYPVLEPWGRLGASPVTASLNLPTPSQLTTSFDCVKVIALDGTLQGMNLEGLCIMEIDDFAAIRGSSWSELWPSEHRSMLDEAVARACAGNVARFSADCPTAKGTPKHWDVVVSPMHDEHGRITGLLSISRDVTREVHIAGERALVTRELAHRIGNLFAIVDGIITLSARATPAVGPFAKALRDRIAGLGRAISFIYGNGDPANLRPSAPTVHGLLGDLLKPYAGATDILIAGDDHPLTSEAITPLALIINELATNSLKYGALLSPNGSVSVITQRDGGDFSLDWVETGVTNVVKPTKSGFGTTLLDRSAMLQLGATITRDWRPEGLAVKIIASASRIHPMAPGELAA